MISKSIIDLKKFVLDLKLYSSQHTRDLEDKLFPWWIRSHNNRTFKSILYRNNTHGIVICTGNGHFLLTLVALQALRTIGNQLPIEVMFSGQNDLSSANQKNLSMLFPEIRLVDLSIIFNDSYLILRGWEIKPFAALASRFQHVLLMDADVLFFEKPSILFENEYYFRTGSLFFYDRTYLRPRAREWILNLSPDNTRTLPKRTQESGVILIDKSRNFLGLLITCKLNEYDQRKEVTYKLLHGDKDTWWLGFHVFGIPYSFMPTMTASIGSIHKDKVCGQMLHLDQHNQPIWWNGGMFKNRYLNTHDILVVEGWLDNGLWTRHKYPCLINLQQKPKFFNPYQKQLFQNYSQITKHVFNIFS